MDYLLEETILSFDDPGKSGCVEFGINTDLSFAPTEIVTFHLEKKNSSRDDFVSILSFYLFILHPGIL